MNRNDSNFEKKKNDICDWREKNLLYEIFCMTLKKETGKVCISMRVGELSKCWVLTERVPGPLVDKSRISSSFYHRDRGPETPSHPWIEIIHGFSFTSTGLL